MSRAAMIFPESRQIATRAKSPRNNLRQLLSPWRARSAATRAALLVLAPLSSSQARVDKFRTVGENTMKRHDQSTIL